MSKHDQVALDAATEIMALVNGPVGLSSDAKLKANIQVVLIDLLEKHATQPAAGEPVYQWFDGAEWRNCANRRDCFHIQASGFPVRELKGAPPAAAHGDEADGLLSAAHQDAWEWRRRAADARKSLDKAIELLEKGVPYVGAWNIQNMILSDKMQEFVAAMRAQGDGE